MKKICFIATGGTIASSETGNGLMPSMAAENLIAYVPQIADLCQVDFVQLMQLDSSNMAPEHWVIMARVIINRYKSYDGFVISHGTDTMAYTAAAMHYMLKNIDKPVVLTGSQLPMENPDTDAKKNLLTAFHAVTADIKGVFLAFDGLILPGVSAKKIYSKRFDAFKSINRMEIGYYDISTDDLYLHEPILRKDVQEKFSPQLELDDRVVVFKLIPGTSPKLLKLLVDAGYKGIILESFGAGGVPSDASTRSFLPTIDYAIEHGTVLVCTTQCVYEGVHMDTYEVGVRAVEHGVIPGGEATVEALTAKLMLALGRGKSMEEVREIMLTE